MTTSKTKYKLYIGVERVQSSHVETIFTDDLADVAQAIEKYKAGEEGEYHFFELYEAAQWKSVRFEYTPATVVIKQLS